MSRYALLKLTAALLLLSACTKTELLTDVPYIDETPVLIRLGASGSIETSVKSKAALESLDEIEPNLIGTFCLAKSKVEAEGSYDEVNWSNVGQNGVYWNNVISDVTPIESSTSYELKPVRNVNNPYNAYYPSDNKYAYEFFSYYPIQGNSNVELSTDKITVTLDVDGSQDVICGKSSVPDGLSDDMAKNCFNARYFRTLETEENAEINFEHKLARIEFISEPASNQTYDKDNGAYYDASQYYIKKIEIINQPQKLLLSKTLNGGIGIISNNDNTRTYTLIGTTTNLSRSGDGSLENPYLPVKSTIGSIMVLPNTSYYVNIHVYKIVGDETDPENSFVIENQKIELSSIGNSFSAGKKYSVNMKISCAPRVAPQIVSLNSWSNGEEGFTMDYSK